MSMEELQKLIKGLRQKLSTGSWRKPKITRVWIDEGKRPLGVPTLVDRVIGSMFSNLLEFYLWDSIRLNHAY